MKTVNGTIQQLLKLQKPEVAAKHTAFLQAAESSEDDFRHRLHERRNKKLSLLSHPTPRTHYQTLHVHTHGPQDVTPGRKMLGQFPGYGGKGKGPRRDSKFFSPYKLPDKTSDNRPVLFPSPVASAVPATTTPAKANKTQDEIRDSFYAKEFGEPN